MASDILGLFTSPQQYQQNQLAQFQNRAFQEVQLNPFQQAALGARTAGYQLGQGIGGALGGQDPQLQLIARRQQLLSQLDQSDPASFARVSKMASDAGDQELAYGIANAGRQAAVQIAQANKERQLAVPADIQKAQMIPQIQDAIDQYKALPVSPERDRAIKLLENQLRVLLPEAKVEKTPDAIQVARRVAELEAQLSPDAGVVLPPQVRAGLEAELGNLKKQEKERNIPFGAEAERKSKSMYGKSYAELTPEEAGKVDKAVEVSEQTKAKLTASPAAVQAKQIAQNKTDFAKAIEESAFNASDRISLAQNLRELAPQAFTGFAADAKLSASKVASAFGIPTKGGTESEIIDQILGQMTIGAAGQLKGALSDKDVLFLKKTIGTRGLSVNTLMFVADEIERLAAQDRYLNKKINQVTQGGGSLNDVNFEEEKSKSSKFVKTQISDYRNIMKKVANNTATLEEAKKAKQIRDELGL
jgi:hypothetical protein